MMILSSQVRRVVIPSVFNMALLTTTTLSMPVHAGGLAEISNTANSQPQRSVLFSVGRTSQSTKAFGQALQGLGYTDIGIGDDEKAAGWSLGYRHPISRHFSADIQYLQQGKTNPNVQATLPLGRTNGQAAKETAESMSRRGQGLSALAVYHHPLTSRLTLQTGFGAFAWESKRIASVGTSAYTSKSDGVSVVFQLGLSYPITTRAKLETQWQHTFMPDEDVDRFSVGIAFGF